MESSVRIISLSCSSARMTKGRLYDMVRDHVVHLGLNVSSSTHNYCRCVVNDYGSNLSIIILV